MAVTVSGAAGAPYAMLAYPDVGLGAQGCFSGLALCAGGRSLLGRHVRLYHIDPPGHGADADADAGRSGAASPRYSLEDLAGDVADVCVHYGLSRDVLLLGAGAGAHVLALYATAPATPRGAVLGGLFITPSATAAGWAEWGYGAALCAALATPIPALGGWQPWAVDAFLARWFSARARGLVVRTDLARGAARRLQEVAPAAAAAYLAAYGARQDITARLSNFRGRALVVCGGACYAGGQAEALAFRAACSPARSVWLEAEGAGALVSEENPAALLRPLHSFLQAVGVVDGSVPMPEV